MAATAWIIVFLVMFNCLVLGEKKREYKLGLLIPYRKVTPYFQNDYNKGESFAAAMTIAVERINANPTLLADYNLTFVWKDTECNELIGVREQLNQIISGVQAFIGPGCYCQTAAKNAAAFNMTMISFMCSASELSDKNEFPTFGRTFPVDSRIAPSIISLLKNTYKWTRIAIIYQNTTRWTSLKEHLQEEFEKNGITVAMKFKVANVPSYNLGAEEELKKALIKIKQTARIVLVIGNYFIGLETLYLAKQVGMINGKFAFITFHLDYNFVSKATTPGPEFWWFLNYLNASYRDRSKTKMDIQEAMQTALIFAVKTTEGKSYEDFVTELKLKTSQSPFNSSYYNESTAISVTWAYRPPIYAAYLYDAVYQFAVALNISIAQLPPAEQKRTPSGQEILSQLRDYTYEGIQGYTTNLDDNGDADFNLTLWDIRNFRGKALMVPVADFQSTYGNSSGNGSKKVFPLLVFRKNMTKIWVGGSTIPPKDRPRCGFNNELCPPPTEKQKEVLSKEAVALSVIGAILFLCIVLGFAFFCFIRHQRKLIVEYRNQIFPVYTGKHQIDPNITLLEQCNDLPYDPDFEFPEDKLILGEVLGTGAFGKVIKAEAIGINNFNPRDKSQKKSQRRPKMFRQHRAGHAYHDPRGNAYTKTTVAVKTVKGRATKEEVRDLASELKILIYVGEHKNIVNLLGACIKRDRILVILEYAPHGSLQKFLRRKRDVYEATWTTTASDPEIGLNISNLVSYSYQISCGMEYLASKKCVHRDLAARNVLVGKDYVMKIADFGLARDIYKSELYVKTNSGVLPMKWMAIESLFLREFSEKSDVWSFGICLWEIFTLGGTPYSTIPVEELLDFLNDGNRMENPRDCPSEIYKIMQDCWQEGPDKRPKFDQISQSIGTIIEQRASQSESTEYLHLTGDNNLGRKDYYLDPHDSDPTVPVTRVDVYDRRSSENIANNPLPPLPGDMEDQFDPESEEKRQMLKPEIYGGSSGSEGDIELEELHGNEQVVALELTPIAHSTEKAGNSKKKTTVV